MGASDRRRRLITRLQARVANPPVRALAWTGLHPGLALLETTGRRSGRPRRIPVTNGLAPGSDTFWLVSEHGRRSAYVRNIEADPRVRVRVRGRWRAGVAHVVPGDDPRARLRTLPRLNALGVRLMGTDLLTVRIDLDPSGRAGR